MKIVRKYLFTRLVTFTCETNLKKILLSVGGLALVGTAFGGNAAADDIKNKIHAAEQSPLFKQKFASSEITARNLDRVVMQNGAELNFKKYTALTRLDTNEKFLPLMNPQTVSRYLRSKPRYSENIIEMEDRLIVERTLDVEIKEGTCAENGLPAAVDELCFKAKAGNIPNETKEYLVNIRKKLRVARPEVVIKQGQTAQQMLAMGDQRLLEFLLNSDNRKVRLVSVLPTRVYNKQTSLNLWSTNTKLKVSKFERPKARVLPLYTAIPKTPQSTNRPRNQVFPTKYFLTGYTIGREIQDEFEIEFARETLFTDRYFVRFSYNFSVGFGLRFPFSVSVTSEATDGRPGGLQVAGSNFGNIAGQSAGNTRSTQPRGTNRRANTGRQQSSSAPRRANTIVPSRRGTDPNATNIGTSNSSGSTRGVASQQRPTLGGQVVCGGNNCGSRERGVKSAKITMSVTPIDVNSNGFPAYGAVGLPQSKYFGGKEFVLEFSAGCEFEASLPGPADININCPTVSKDYSRQIKPVIGSAKAKLGALWIDGTALGLAVDVWAGKASIDFGIQANLTDGRIGMTAKGFNGTTIRGTQNSTLKFNSPAPISFDVKNTSGTTAFQLTDPSYGFDLEILPVARIKLNLDLGVYELKKTLGPYGIDALSLSLGFTLPRHEGTVNSHVYIP